MIDREEILREIGITPIWKLRDAPLSVAASSPVAEQKPGRPASTSAPAPASAAAHTRDAAISKKPMSVESRSIVTPKPTHATPTASAELLNDDAATLNWDELRTRVSGCRACGLCEGRRNTVFGVGDESADWMIIGEAPGAEEDARGEPFVGQAGQLLDSMLASLKLTRAHKVYIANVLKCRPPGNRNPEAAEVAQCSPFLLRQIALVKPKLIVLMGRFAAQTVLQTDATIASLRGRVFSFADTPTIVTYHPAYLLRTLPDKAKAWQDLLLAQKTLTAIAD